jgi:uncharacterized protein
MKYYPIIAVTGPRQSGKTTMLKEQFPEYKYISFEDPDTRAYASKDGRAFLQENDRKVIFDEVQRVPELFSYLQTFVDEKKVMGQFILSGSQNFNLLKSITQSLAGRVAMFKLLPFDFSELDERLPSNYLEMIIKGAYPAIYDRQIPSKTFYSNYIQTYIERDLSELLAVKDLKLFRTFLKLCAARVGQQLNISHLANDAGISPNTARSWLSILEASYILYLLPPFFKNFNKRLVKSPKMYFYDTGLVCHLLGIRKAESLSINQFKGPLFENLIINEYQKQNYHQNKLEDFYFWRDSNGIEVDLLQSNETAFNAIAIKATSTISNSLFQNLDKLSEIGGDTIAKKILVYGGLENQNRTNYNVRSWFSIGI